MTNEEHEIPNEARREFERAHKELNNKITKCLNAMIIWLGDPMTIEHGILETLTWAQKKQLLDDMREALRC